MLLSDKRAPKISDFGLSMIRAETASHTRHGEDAKSKVGTVRWMAPE